MANCLITQGVDITCANKRRSAGVKTVWLGNLSNLRAPISDVEGQYVTSIEFNGYDGLYRFDSTKFAHQATSTIAIGDGGAVSWTQELILRLFNDTPGEDQAINDLTTSDLIAIVLTNNNEFFILGAQNGVSATAGVGQTGRNIGDDTATSITLTGTENQMWRRLLRTDFQTTLAYVTALQF